MTINNNDSNLVPKIIFLCGTAAIPIIFVLSLGYDVEEFNPIPWLTLIIGAVIGIAVAIIVSTKSENILTCLTKSEKDKKEYAKFILTSNFKQLRKLVENYFKTINESNPTTREKRTLLKTILPSVSSFLNICEIALPNVGNQLTRENITNINNHFIKLHILLIILGAGSDTKFETNLSNLDSYTEEALNDLEEM